MFRCLTLSLVEEVPIDLFSSLNERSLGHVRHPALDRIAIEGSTSGTGHPEMVVDNGDVGVREEVAKNGIP